MKIISGKQRTKIKAVIYGPEGIGKSTMASRFPDPLFIDVEGGTHALNVDRLAAPQSWTALMVMLDQLAGAQAPEGYKTLVIDTADWAEKLLRDSICAEVGVASIGDRSFGVLYQKLGAQWGKFLDKLSLIGRQMHICLLAHSNLVRCEIPEEHGAFDRYELKLNNSFKVNTSAMTKEWAGMVLFLNYETILVQSDKGGKSKAQGGRRMVHTSHHTCWDAKNRYGLPAKLKLPEDGMPPELAEVIAALDAEPPTATTPITPPVVPAPPPAAPVTPPVAPMTPAVAPEPAAPLTVPPAAPVAPAPAPPTPPPAPMAADTPERAGYLRQLGELMTMSKVSFQALDWELARKGVVPAGTNPRNYNEQTLKRIINGWEAITLNIKYNYKEEKETSND